jgi:hypothetical protein
VGLRAGLVAMENGDNFALVGLSLNKSSGFSGDNGG